MEAGELGELARTEAVLQTLLSTPVEPPDRSGRRSAGPLTPREREVATLIARGLTNRQIAEGLVISERTAERHVENILGKLDLASRTQIGVWVVKHGLATRPSR